MPNPKTFFTQTFEDDDPLFAVNFHPEKKIFATGFATGRVTVSSYDDDGKVTQQWTTKRHKTSCRAVKFDQEGEYLYSVGTDRVLKRANAETGKVVGKNIDALSEFDPTVMLVNESYVLVGDEDANLHVFDNKTLKRTHYFEALHDDNITSIVDWPFKNKYHFLTTGSTTVVHLDIRKGEKSVISTSDDQEDELLSGCLASEKYTIYGMSEGVVTIWDNTRGMQDQTNRMRLSDESIDCVIAGEDDNIVYAGGADGIVKKLNVKASRVEPILYTHSKSGKEEVGMLDFDCEYRLVTGSMNKLKVWQKEDEMESEDEEEEGSDEESSSKKRKKKGKKKQPGAKKHKQGISQFADL